MLPISDELAVIKQLNYHIRSMDIVARPGQLNQRDTVKYQIAAYVNILISVSAIVCLDGSRTTRGRYREYKFRVSALFSVPNIKSQTIDFN